MRFDNLMTPVTDDDPCGSDLDEDGDEAYLNYVLSAAGRIPDSYYRKDPNAPISEARYVPFDRGSIDLKSEVAAIRRLLARTKDLRLLTLEARFQCLAGQVAGFCDCLEAIATLVDGFWDDVHPRGAGIDFTMRRNILSGLDDQASILLPLAYAPLTVSKKIGAVSLRDYLLITGSVQPREDDRRVELSDILDALQSSNARPAIASLHAAVSAGERSLATVQERFAAAVGHELSPNFTNLANSLDQIRGLIVTAVPELAVVATTDAADAIDEVPQADTRNDQPVPAPVGGTGGALPAVSLADHAAASAALLAVEQYFARTEPSSPALILIHQARILVGKPLVEALEMLMPEGAARAVIGFTGGLSFQLDMSRMKAITKTVTENANAEATKQPQEVFSANTRREAEALINSVDAFFRANEPSSPVPMLIGKARAFMNRDFSAILAELIKSEPAPPPS